MMISPDLDRPSVDQRIILRLSNVEVRFPSNSFRSSQRPSLQMFNFGQAFRANRYPINFYRNGNMSSSYIKSCSIHSSSNRAIHIEATDFLTLEGNVIYRIM